MADKDDNYGLWLAKLHGQAARLAFAIHVWNSPTEPQKSPISKREVEQAILIAEACKHGAQFLFSPHGLKAMEDAKRIVTMLKKKRDAGDMARFYDKGTCITDIQQRTGMKRIDIYPAVQYLEKRNWLTYIDDGSGNWPILPHKDFYR